MRDVIVVTRKDTGRVHGIFDRLWETDRFYLNDAIDGVGYDWFDKDLVTVEFVKATPVPADGFGYGDKT
jgi:hypothetical protein